jgi:hypothetical protein
LFDILRPGGAQWQWTVTYKVASSGYPTRCHVSSFRHDPNGDISGSASCDVNVGDDLREVIEFLAVESMLEACEPTLWDDAPHRECRFESEN